MEEVSINILMETKTEWTKQLTNTLTIPIYEGFKSLYDDAKQETDPRYQDLSELQLFQEYLKKIPRWNQNIIDNETERIIKRTKVSYLDDVITMVFLCNVQVLSVVRLKNPTNEIDIKVPKVKNFIHRCYMECGREIYQNAYLFDTEELPTYEIQKNNREILNIIKESIIEAVRKLLPVQDIIKNYIGKINEETEDITLDKDVYHSDSFTHIKKTLKKGLNQIESDDENNEDDDENNEDDDENNDESDSKSSQVEKNDSPQNDNPLTLSSDIVNEIEDNLSKQSSINDDIISVNSQNQDDENNILEQEYSQKNSDNQQETPQETREPSERYEERRVTPQQTRETPQEYQERREPSGGYQERREPSREYQERREPSRGYQERREPSGGYEERREPFRGYEERREPSGGYEERREPSGGYEERRVTSGGYEERREIQNTQPNETEEVIRYLPQKQDVDDREVEEIMNYRNRSDSMEDAYTKLVTMPTENRKKRRLRSDKRLLKSKHKLVVQKSNSPIQKEEVFRNVQNNLESEDENNAVFFDDAPDQLESDFEEDDYSTPHQY